MGVFTLPCFSYNDTLTYLCILASRNPGEAQATADCETNKPEIRRAASDYGSCENSGSHASANQGEAALSDELWRLSGYQFSSNGGIMSRLERHFEANARLWHMMVRLQVRKRRCEQKIYVASSTAEGVCHRLHSYGWEILSISPADLV